MLNATHCITNHDMVVLYSLLLYLLDATHGITHPNPITLTLSLTLTLTLTLIYASIPVALRWSYTLHSDDVLDAVVNALQTPTLHTKPDPIRILRILSLTL